MAVTPNEDRRLELLDDATCRHLLSTAGTGRLGFSEGALPAILPVPFTFRHGRVVIPAHRRSSVASAVRGAVVAFEVDCYDVTNRTGWSVTVVGPTRLLGAPADLAVPAHLRDASALTAAEHCFIAVELGIVRGWRTSANPAAEPMADRRASAPP